MCGGWTGGGSRGITRRNSIRNSLPRPGCERTMAVVFFEILAARRVALDRETDRTCATFTRPGETVGLDVRASSVVRSCRARRSEADDCPPVLSYERRQAS